MQAMPIDPKFIVNLQGKDHPLYAGILAEAHSRGLQAIETLVIQIPTADNDHTAIVRAIVQMKDGSTFTGYGDANPKNVNPRIATALLRMAETRAKGRALRDAIDCGATMLEELPDLEEEEKPRYPPDKWGAKKPEVVGTPKQQADAALHEAAARGREKMLAPSGMTPAGAVKGPVVCGVCKVPFTIEQIAHCDKHGLDYIHPKCIKIQGQDHG
jgi:hypothetical protein